MTYIPCKRPRVRINCLPGLDKIAVVCDVPGCGFHEPDHVVHASAHESARWHRAAHRSAVPNAEVGGPTVSLNYFANCACGWSTGDGVNTRTDNELALAHHLSTAHGLVTCP